MASIDTTTTPVTSGGGSSSFGSDLLASVVVFLVALPLCMGIAIASNMPPAAGLITGIVGGIIVGSIAGSPLQVSGPAAGLAVLIWQLVDKHGLGMIGVIVFFAGLIQLAAGLLKLGQWFRAVSPAVIHGMLAGIGILIFVAQFHVMLDYRPIGTGIQNLLGIPNALMSAISSGDGHLTAGGIGLLTIASIFGWSSFAPKELKAIPAPLVGVAVGMIAAALLHLTDIKYVQVSDNLFSGLMSGEIFPSFANLARIVEPEILIGAISVAFIASAETLLCATAVDQMHSGPRTKYDRELAAQGIGNTICGFLSALPMTGVIVRSSATVEAGAVTRLSAILHGIWLLLFVALLPWTLGYIPMAGLAAVLVFTGYKLAYPKILPVLQQFGRMEVLIYVVTIATIVFTDLLKGVVLGLILSLGKLLHAFSQLDVSKQENGDANRIDVNLDGAATLVRLPILARALEDLKPGSEVHIHTKDLDYIDHACLDLLTNWERQHKATGGILKIEWDELRNKYFERHGRPPEGVPQTAK